MWAWERMCCTNASAEEKSIGSVTAAGICPEGPFESHTRKEVQKCIDVNVRAIPAVSPILVDTALITPEGTWHILRCTTSSDADAETGHRR